MFPLWTEATELSSPVVPSKSMHHIFTFTFYFYKCLIILPCYVRSKVWRIEICARNVNRLILHTHVQALKSIVGLLIRYWSSISIVACYSFHMYYNLCLCVVVYTHTSCKSGIKAIAIAFIMYLNRLIFVRFVQANQLPPWNDAHNYADVMVGKILW